MVYVVVPGPQTIVAAPATFTGGVVFGFASFFPAIAFATKPNVYGTANFGNGLSKAITIAIDPAFTTTEVSFALFNGETFNQSYTVNAFNRASLVANQTLNNIAPNFNSGFGLVDLNNLGGITSVTIAPTGTPSVWDFLVDTVAFNQNITSVINVPLPPVVPQPPNHPRRWSSSPCPRPRQSKAVATVTVKLNCWRSTLAMTSTIFGVPCSWSRPPYPSRQSGP